MKKIGKSLAIRIQENQNQYPFQSHIKESNSNSLRHTQQYQSDEDRIKTDPTEHFPNVVEFQQFLIDDQKQYSCKKTQNDQRMKPISEPILEQSLNQMQKKNRRQYCIQIPEGKSQKSKVSGGCLNNQKDQFKEPLAPSNKKSFNSKGFVFPVTNQTQQLSEIQEYKDKKTQKNIEELLKNFDIERQQFYRQKSRFQKQILVKQGQIQMLQKMLTGRIGGQGRWNSLHHFQQLQTVLLQKDLQISELLQKISQLSNQLSQRGEELRQVQMQCNRLSNINESILNQIYLYQKKQINCKTTQQFYDIKKQRSATMGARGWDADVRKEEMRYSGLEDLQKRLQNLKQNRLQLEDKDRSKIKSQVTYSQTAKYKHFDGKAYFEYKKSRC